MEGIDIHTKWIDVQLVQTSNISRKEIKPKNSGEQPWKLRRKWEGLTLAELLDLLNDIFEVESDWDEAENEIYSYFLFSQLSPWCANNL